MIYYTLYLFLIAALLFAISVINGFDIFGNLLLFYKYKPVQTHPFDLK